MRIHLLSIGDELLIGQVVNTNAAWMAQQLNLIGAVVTGISTAPDDLGAIQRTLTAALADNEAVLITGGLGPTKDDITKTALCAYYGVELVFHEPTFERLVRLFARFGRIATDAHRAQCLLPANAEVLINQQGTAPGMWMEREGKVVVAMPGVPYEMEYLMSQEVLPRLRARFGGRPILHRTLLTVGEGETFLAEKIADLEDALPPHLKLAYLPNLGQVRLRLTGMADDEITLAAELDQQVQLLRNRLGNLVFGEGDTTLQAAVGEALLARGLSLGTAESCTGGYLAHLITSVAGSSRYFQGSILAYDNRIKTQLLDVDPAILAGHGAVSEATVRAMVAGAVRRLGVDVAVATSGIAGPGGGTPDKPVGTIWLAVGNAHHTMVKLLSAGKDRSKNIHFASIHALDLVRRFVADIPG